MSSEDTSLTPQVCIGYDAHRATLVWFRDAVESAERYDVYTAVIELQGRGIIAAAPLMAMHKHELHDLLLVLEEEASNRYDRHVGSLDHDGAARVIAQAALQSRIAGRVVPDSVFRTPELLGDIAGVMSALDDAFNCPSCGEGLPGGSQLALAEGTLNGPIECDACRGAELATLRPYSRFVPLWIARAQLMLAGGLPRKALIIAHQAEQAGAEGTALARIRGWAQLMLGNATQAQYHLQDAVAAIPNEPRTRLMLILARAQASMAIDALSHLPYLEQSPELGVQLLEPLRQALDGLSRPDMGRPDAVVAACHRLLGVLEHG